MKMFDEELHAAYAVYAATGTVTLVTRKMMTESIGND